MLLINFFLFFYFFFLTEEVGVYLLPYSVLESKQAGEELDALLSAFTLRLKKSKKLFRSQLQNYFNGKL